MKYADNQKIVVFKKKFKKKKKKRFMKTSVSWKSKKKIRKCKINEIQTKIISKKEEE